MDKTRCKLVSLKYEANLLYCESILEKSNIAFESRYNDSFDIFVHLKDLKQATAIINSLGLDEAAVDEESSGYIEGYREWADKMYVNGYFTGGYIPRWMYNKNYAAWFGPVTIVIGVFCLGISASGNFKIDNIELLVWGLLNLICGTLLTVRGCRK